MSEDKKLAEKMAIEELRNTVRVGRDLGIPQQVVSYEHGNPEKDLPTGDGDGMILPIVIGMRGRLSKSEARKAARMWRHAIARYPKAIFYLNMLGYDQDPREIWEIVDAARYVRWFARAAVSTIWTRRCGSWGQVHRLGKRESQSSELPPLRRCKGRWGFSLAAACSVTR